MSRGTMKLTLQIKAVMLFMKSSGLMEPWGLMCVELIHMYCCVLLLQGADRGKGKADGTFRHKKLFSCEKNCGIFAPFSRVSPVVPSSLSPSMSEPPTQAQTDELSPGDRVTYFTNKKCRHGMVVEVKGDDGKVWISTVRNFHFLDFIPDSSHLEM